MRTRPYLLGVAASLWVTPVAASNEREAEAELNVGPHLAYGAGGSFMPTAHPPGFRHHLEAAVADQEVQTC
jgi:hypothetical protein